jgi:nucleoside-diphosphate-sugar epimerase
VSDTVLVTGGSGFLGGWCAAELLRRGDQVRTTVRDSSREQQMRAMLDAEVDAGEKLSVVQADLGADEGWAEAVAGCDYVLHVASPFPPEQPKDPDELIVPARDGALRVLRAALDAGVKRTVMTSSVAAIRNTGKPSTGPHTELDWSDASNTKLTPYTRSKTIAEQAAWEEVRKRDATDRLAVVNPGAILGPVLSEHRSYSLEVIERMLKGMPGVPRLGFSFVDVRDVAALQIAAMAASQAGGERFIATAEFLWMSDVAEILRDELGDVAEKVPTRTVPNFVVRAMALFDPGIRSVVGSLGQKETYSNDKAREKLGWSPRPLNQTIADCARSLLGDGAGAASAS